MYLWVCAYVCERMCVHMYVCVSVYVCVPVCCAPGYSIGAFCLDLLGHSLSLGPVACSLGWTGQRVPAPSLCPGTLLTSTSHRAQLFHVISCDQPLLHVLV